MNHYKMVELTEGEYVQFVGVHALKWRPEWGKPEVGFIEEDYDDSPSLPKLEERNAELVEALKSAVRIAYLYAKDPQQDPTKEGAWIRAMEELSSARALLAKEAANE